MKRLFYVLQTDENRQIYVEFTIRWEENPDKRWQSVKIECSSSICFAIPVACRFLVLNTNENTLILNLRNPYTQP